MKSDPTYVTAETMYQPDSLRMGKGRESITASLQEATVAATYVEADAEVEEPAGWTVTPQFLGIYCTQKHATAGEALEACRDLLRRKGFIADKAEAQRVAESQAYARRHQFDGLPTDLAGTVARLREQGVLTSSRTLSEKWWKRGVSKYRARMAMLGDKQAMGLIRRDSCDVSGE